MGLAAGGHLGDGLDAATAGLGDLAERAFQRSPGDALAAVPLVDIEAGDPPVRPRRRVLVVLAPVLDVRELAGAAVLAPPLRGAVVIEDQSRVRAAVADPRLLGRAIVRPLLGGHEVISDAPASAEDAVVAFDKLGEGIPGRCVQRTGCVRHHRVLSSTGLLARTRCYPGLAPGGLRLFVVASRVAVRVRRRAMPRPGRAG